MFEIPFNVILINPIFDMSIFVFSVYFFVFRLYREMVEKDADKIQWMDLKLTFIFIAFAYLNYQGLFLKFFGLEMDWLSWILIIQIFVEGVFVFFYWDDVKRWWKKNKKVNEENGRKNLKKQIEEFEFIKKVMEDDVEQLKSRNKKKAVSQLENEVKKVSRSIKEMEGELNKSKNDKKK